MTEKTHKVLLITPTTASQRAALCAQYPTLHVVNCADDRDRVPTEVRDAHIAYGRVKPEEFPLAEALEYIQLSWHGVENMCYPELVASDVQVANCRGMCSQSMTEHVFALILSYFRGIPQAFKFQTLQTWVPEPTEMPLLMGMRIGVMGTGSIGNRIAEVAQAFGCPCIGLNTRGEAEGPYEQVYAREALHDFLGACDIVVSTLPNTPATCNMIDAAAFKAMRKTALFINVGRGTTVDTEALIAALEQNAIAGAALDVTHPEPLPDKHLLWSAKNCIITPHRSGLNPYNGEVAFALFLRNLGHYLAGRPLESLVDLKRGY